MSIKISQFPRTHRGGYFFRVGFCPKSFFEKSLAKKIPYACDPGNCEIRVSNNA